jgi:uncharacterized protein
VKPRHVPVRTCAGCREEHPKREMVRVVRSPEGSISVDPSGKQNGRGTYLCPQVSCWDKALRSGSLAKALKVTISASDRDELEKFKLEYATRPEPTVLS